MSEVDFKDGGEQTICCGECQKKLVNYRVYAPNVKIRHRLIAVCPFCSGNSFVKEINGLFWYGPVGSEQSNYPTLINDLYEKDSIWYVDVRKLNE